MAPVALPRDMLAWAVNVECRTDFLRPRPGWQRRPLTYLGADGTQSAAVQALFEDAIFQGAIVFERFSQLVCMIGGHLFRIDPLAWTVTDISTPGDLNPSNLYRAWFCEAESWVIAQDGVSIPWIYDGASTVRSDTIGAGGRVQVPIGKAMCYSQGRLIVAYSSGRAFVVGDIVGGDSGTAPYDFKDSVLCFTENDIINGGGSFSVPINAGLLTAFRPIAQIDTSMGQGPTQVFTTGAIFSLNLPTDRTTWQDVNFPIGTVSNVANGATSDRCTSNVNGDIWFRAPDGVRSFMVARRDFQAAWINAPLSQEISRALDGDDESLLGYASDCYFDNRRLQTVHPYRVWDHGIAHEGLVQLDFQPVATLSERNPLPTWLGNATGVTVLQVLTGNVSGVPRGFIFALSAANKVELWEISKRAKSEDNGVEAVPIQWAFETGAFTFAASPTTGGPVNLPSRELWSLDGGRLYVDEIDGTVSFALQWKPDQDPCWHDWHSWSVCADTTPCPTDDCECPSLPQYRKFFNLPAPRDPSCDASVDKPYHIGREFQVRAVITGYCRVKCLELIAHAQEEDVSGLCAATEACVAVRCSPPDDYSYRVPPSVIPPAATGACCLDGQCSITTEAACTAAGGTYLGDNTTCDNDPCTRPPTPATGACCIAGECSVLTEAACIAAGGTYMGDNTTCREVVCAGDIPPAPTWPIPTPYACTGDAFWGPIAVDDPVRGSHAYVGINPGPLDPATYVATFGPPGCLNAWCAEVWSQFLAAGIPYSSARLVWYNNTLLGSNFMGTEVFPAQAGGYHPVADLTYYIAVEHCPLSDPLPN